MTVNQLLLVEAVRAGSQTKGGARYKSKKTEMEKARTLWICAKEILVNKRWEALSICKT
jgi:hypothetical protein